MHGREGLSADATLRKALNDAEAFMTLRFKLPPGGDVPPITAARRMGLSLDAFRDALPELVARGFPQADETTGNFDLDADSLDLTGFPLRSPATIPDVNEVIRQKIIAGLTPARNP
jgi:hypothetical protein